MYTFKSDYKPSVLRENPAVGYAVTSNGFHLIDTRFDEVCEALKIAKAGNIPQPPPARINAVACGRMYKKLTKLLTDNPTWGVDDNKRPLPRRMLLNAFAAFCKEASQNKGMVVHWQKGWD